MNQATQAEELAGVLNAGQIAAFHRDGFVVAKALFGPDEVAAIAEWTDEVQQWPETPGRHMMYFEDSLNDEGRKILNRVENLLPFHERFNALATGPQMQGACGQLFGEPAVLFKDKINFKLPGGDGFAAHQDVQAGWAKYAPLHITALITIDRTTIENGCLEMAAGLHDRGLIGSEWEPLTEADTGGTQYVAIEAEPGDAVFFDSFAPHRSGPNRTNEARRVLYFTYNKLSAGDHLAQYYADKRESYPPDIERDPDKDYRYRV
jgi:ectoine hydroxylase-related dioxygenase (phytanoyl-CoA dioxygenase family)